MIPTFAPRLSKVAQLERQFNPLFIGCNVIVGGPKGARSVVAALFPATLDIFGLESWPRVIRLRGHACYNPPVLSTLSTASIVGLDAEPGLGEGGLG